MDQNMEQNNWSDYNNAQQYPDAPQYPMGSAQAERNVTFSPDEATRKKVTNPYLIVTIVALIVFPYTVWCLTPAAVLASHGNAVMTGAEAAVVLTLGILYLVRWSQGKNQLVTLREHQIDVETYYANGNDRTNYIIRSVSSVNVSGNKIEIHGDIEKIGKDKKMDTLKILRVHTQEDEQRLLGALENMGRGMSPVDAASGTAQDGASIINMMTADHATGLGTAGLVLGICGYASFFILNFIPLVLGVIGIVLAAVARSRGDKTNIATAGLVLSIVAVVLEALYLLLY